MDILDRFAIYLQTDGCVTERTANEYLRDARSFLSFVGTGEFTPEAVRLWISSRECKNSSKNRFLASVKKLSKFMYREHICSTDFAATIGRLKQSHSLPVIYSQDEMNRLLSVVNDVYYKAFFECMYATGCRVSELLYADISQLDVAKAALKVMGKGRKERWVYLTDIAFASVQVWIGKRARHLRKKSQYLFCNPETGKPPALSTIWRKMQHYCTLAGTPPIGTHGMRRAFITHLLEENANMEAVSELAGHATIRTTQVYARLSDEAKRRVHRLHPRAKLLEGGKAPC